MTGISLSAMRAVDQSDLEILANGEPTGWVITLAGPGHPKTVALHDDVGRRVLHREAQKEQAQVNGRKYKAVETDIGARRRENVADVVARIIDWKGLNDDGAEIKFSADEAVKILLDPALGWAFQQVRDYLDDERSFMRRSATA